MTHVARPVVWGLFVAVGIYLVTVGYFMNYLKRTHYETWLGLGSPSIILNNSIRNGLLTLRFLLSAKYKALNDPKLATLVWGIRALFLLCLVLMLVANVRGYK